MLIKWLERLAAKGGERDAAKLKKVSLCVPCTVMGLILFAALVALVYWIIQALAS